MEIESFNYWVASFAYIAMLNRLWDFSQCQYLTAWLRNYLLPIHSHSIY